MGTMPYKAKLKSQDVDVLVWDGTEDTIRAFIPDAYLAMNDTQAVLKTKSGVVITLPPGSLIVKLSNDIPLFFHPSPAVNWPEYLLEE